MRREHSFFKQNLDLHILIAHFNRMAISKTTWTRGNPIAQAGAETMKTVAALNRAYAKDVSWLARKYTKKAIRTIASIMCDEEANASSRVQAAKILLDRGWGGADRAVDPLAGLDEAQLRDAAMRLAAMYKPQMEERIVVHSEKTVIMNEGGRPKELGELEESGAKTDEQRLLTEPKEE